MLGIVVTMDSYWLLERLSFIINDINVFELKNKIEQIPSYWICLGFQAVLDRGLFIVM